MSAVSDGYRRGARHEEILTTIPAREPTAEQKSAATTVVMGPEKAPKAKTWAKVAIDLCTGGR